MVGGFFLQIYLHLDPELYKNFKFPKASKKNNPYILSLINPSDIVCSFVCKITYMLRYVRK